MRSPSSPCSGRGAFGSVVSHLRAADGGEQHRVGLAARGQGLVGQRGPVGIDRGTAERVLGEGEVAEAREDLERRGGDLGADPVPWKHGDAHSHGPGSLWFWQRDDGHDQRGAAGSASSSRPSGRPGTRPSASPPRTRGCSTSARTSSSCWRWWPPRRTRRRRSSRRWARRSCTSARTCAGPSATPTSSTRATGALRPSGVWYLEDEERFAAFREPASTPSSSRGCRPTSWPPASSAWVTDVARRPGLRAARGGPAAGLRSGFAFPILVGARPVGVLEFFTGGARGGRSRGCCTSWTRSASSSGVWSSASAGAPSSSAPTPTSRPSPTSPPTTWPSRCARSRGSSRCSSASTAIGSTTRRASSSPTRSTASSACSA